MGLLDRQFAEHFAREWIEAWNSHDLDRILAHYSEGFELSSPKIVELMGEPSGRLTGKAAIRPYWAKALARIPDLKFELLTVLAGIDSLALYYRGSGGAWPRKSLSSTTAVLSGSLRHTMTAERGLTGQMRLQERVLLRNRPPSSDGASRAFARR